MKYWIYFIALFPFFMGCIQQGPKPGIINVFTEPDISFEKDPDTDFDKYEKFALCPVAELDKELNINPIVEKQLLYQVRNKLESLGYSYVKNIEESDFYIGIIFANEYKSSGGNVKL